MQSNDRLFPTFWLLARAFSRLFLYVWIFDLSSKSVHIKARDKNTLNISYFVEFYTKFTNIVENHFVPHKIPREKSFLNTAKTWIFITTRISTNNKNISGEIGVGHQVMYIETYSESLSNSLESRASRGWEMMGIRYRMIRLRAQGRSWQYGLLTCWNSVLRYFPRWSF